MSHTFNDHPAVEVTKKEYLQPMTMNDAGIPHQQQQPQAATINQNDDPAIARRHADHVDPAGPRLQSKEPGTISQQEKPGFGQRLRAGMFAAASKVHDIAHEAKEKIRPSRHSELEELPFYGEDLSPKSRPYGTL